MEMSEKKYIGTFYSERKLLDEIDVLKKQGNIESDMFIVSNSENDIGMIRGRTEAEVTTSGDENWLKKMKHFIMGEEPIRGAFERMGFSKEKANAYYAEAKKGGMLLFVDKEYGATAQQAGFSPYVKELDYVETSVGAEPATAHAYEEPGHLNHVEGRKNTNRTDATMEKVHNYEEPGHLNHMEEKTMRTAESNTTKAYAVPENEEPGGVQADTAHSYAEPGHLNHLEEKTMRTAEADTTKAYAVPENEEPGGAEADTAHSYAEPGHLNHVEGRAATPSKQNTLEKAAAGEPVDPSAVQAGDRVSNDHMNKKKPNPINEKLDHRLDDEKPHK